MRKPFIWNLNQIQKKIMLSCYVIGQTNRGSGITLVRYSNHIRVCATVCNMEIRAIVKSSHCSHSPVAIWSTCCIICCTIMYQINNIGSICPGELFSSIVSVAVFGSENRSSYTRQWFRCYWIQVNAIELINAIQSCANFANSCNPGNLGAQL